MSDEKHFVIGKNVIETLTLGMYEDSRFIYREYVQNAADQIDIAVEQKILSEKSKGLILITIDDKERKIIIEDNATGIESENALQFLGDVARSEKDADKRKGFRGIGRLGGLGYCEKLIFETSAKNEPIKSTVNLDAKLLKRILLDKTNNIDAASVISLITTLDLDEEDESSHYFKVTLEGVTNDDLLNRDYIIEYLSMVAPLPFREEFKFEKEIHDYFNDNNYIIDEYNVKNIVLNKEKLYKAYTETIVDKDNNKIDSKIISVEFFNLKDSKNELLAIGWYGISNILNFKLSQNNISRGLRIRKDNITIGNEHTVSRFFNEARFNHHYIGEIHVTGSGFIPNARRDYFNDSNTVTSFENELKEQCKLLTKLAHTCSNINNRFEDIKRYKETKKKFEEDLENNVFVSREYEEDERKQIEKTKIKAESASNTLMNIELKAEPRSAVKTLFENIVGNFDILIDGSESKAKITEKYPVDELDKLNSSERELVLEILRVIKDNLPRNQSSKIQRKIIEKITA